MLVSQPSLGLLQEAVNAAGWVNRVAGEEPIGASPFIQATLAGLQRQLAKPKVRKEPVTSDMLGVLVESLGLSPLTEVRLATMVLISFAAFLRYDELAKLKCCDLSFSEQCLTVKIRSSKTDQFRQGDAVLIARTGSVTCPVAMAERYVAMARHFTQLGTSFVPWYYSYKSRRATELLSLSYTRVRELFLAKLSSLGYDTNNLVFIASDLEEHRQLLMLVCPIGCLNAMGAGVLKQPRMAMSRTPC